DLVTTDVMPGPACRLPQLPCPVDPVVVVPQGAQHRAQLGVPDRTRRGRASPGGVVGAHSHLHPCCAQHGADGLDCETHAVDDVAAVGVDERDYLLCWRSSSAMLLCQSRAVMRLLGGR